MSSHALCLTGFDFIQEFSLPPPGITQSPPIQQVALGPEAGGTLTIPFS